MADYQKGTSFIGLRGGVADPQVFDIEFQKVAQSSATKADTDLPNTFNGQQTFSLSPTIPAGGSGSQPLTATEIAANLNSRIVALETTINTLLAKKAPLASPTLSGAPRVPTVTTGNSSTLIASTAFVQTAVSAIPTAPANFLDNKTGYSLVKSTQVSKTPVTTMNTAKPSWEYFILVPTRYVTYFIGSISAVGGVYLPPNTLITAKYSGTQTGGTALATVYQLA